MSARDFSTQTGALLDALCEHLFARLQTGEDVNVNLDAEETLYLRFNHTRIRQSTDVTQRVLDIRYQASGRTIDHGITLSGQIDADCRSIDAILERCRHDATVLPQDPFQVPVQNHGSSREIFKGQLLAPAPLIAAIVEPAGGCDLVGFYAGGLVISANRNSQGQNHWFETENFFFDYSLYSGPQAVKSVYAASSWNAHDWAAKLARSKASLELLKRPLQDVQPGPYRSYFAPAAFAELLGMLSWGALSAAAWKQGRSPFKKMIEKEMQLSPLLSVAENFGIGLTPRFNDVGEVAPQSLDLIEAGSLRNLLVSSRSAKEYGLQANGAAGHESPRALDVATGTLKEQDVLSALGSGLYLSNLHYLNWSDPVSARVTGMTRYACFWVEGGEIVGPINNLRWDESLYNALGPQLLALGSQAEISPEVGTYSKRSTGGSRAPGALIDSFHFTL